MAKESKAKLLQIAVKRVRGYLLGEGIGKVYSNYFLTVMDGIQ